MRYNVAMISYRRLLVAGAVTCSALIVPSVHVIAAPSCSDSYTGSDAGDPLNGDLADNWSAGLPGSGAYACIGGAFGQVSMGAGEAFAGIAVTNAAGLRLHNNAIELTGAATPSVINNLDVGSLATFTVDKGVQVTLTGTAGGISLDGFGSAAIAGAGTLTVAKNAVVGFAGGMQGSVTFQVASGGHVVLHSGYFDHAVGARFLNYGNVTIAKPPSPGFVEHFGTNSKGIVINEKGATVSDPARASRFSFDAPVVNLGVVTISKGQSLSVTQGGAGVEAAGTWRTAGGATMAFAGDTFDLRKATLTGPGTFNFKLGTVRLSGQHLARVKQCGTTRGPFTVTKSWISSACVSNGVAVMRNAAGHAKTTTTLAHHAHASIGYGGALVVTDHQRLVNHTTLRDQADICIAGGGQLVNAGDLIGVKAPNGTTSRAIHPNCGLAGAEGKLVNAKHGVLWGKSATLVISTRLVNHGHKRGEIQILG